MVYPEMQPRGYYQRVSLLIYSERTEILVQILIYKKKQEVKEDEKNYLSLQIFDSFPSSLSPSSLLSFNL